MRNRGMLTLKLSCRARSIEIATLVAGIVLAFWPTAVHADGIVLRPHTGVAYAASMSNGDSGLGFHAGLRAQADVSPVRSGGFEITYIDPFAFGDKKMGDRKRYIAAGFVLEQRLWKWFHMAIGTIGYIGIESPRTNPFGVVTNLGWEPDTAGTVRPFITYRSEWIFSNPVISINGISVGIGFQP